MNADCVFKLHSTLLYAVDQILLPGSERALQKPFHAFDKISNGCNLSISAENTKLICFFVLNNQ